GTVHAVLRFLVGHQVRIGMRERSGPGKGEVVWRAPHQQGLVNMLRNPAYAGIYAYGRSRTDRSRRLPGHEHSGRVRRLDAGEWRCQQMAAPFLDDHVVAKVLSALAPAALELSVTAAGQVETRRAEVDRIWRQRLERADFACDRARRQYQLAEPENRLVARQLEKDWEAALAERQRLGEEYDRFTAARPRTLTDAEREQIRALAADIPAIWNAPTTTDADRKQLIRHLIQQVRITVLGTSEKVDVE